MANRCAFWDMREKMGGKGAMREWVTAGLAQYDHVHFTPPGYRRLGIHAFPRPNVQLRQVQPRFERSLAVRVLMTKQEQITEIIRRVSKKDVRHPIRTNPSSIRGCSIRLRCRMF